jgi:hypothetical protein
VSIDPILFPGDADPGGRDDVAADVAGSVASATARYHEHMTDTYGLGSTIGDVIDLPPTPAYQVPPPPLAGYVNSGDEPIDAA